MTQVEIDERAEIEFIRQYLQAARDAVKLLLSNYPAAKVWDVRRANGRRGAIRQKDGRRISGVYCFHGSGCRFRLRHGLKIDVDFDNEGGSRIFDEWRIHLFASENSQLQPPATFGSLNDVGKSFERLSARKLILRYGSSYWELPR
jgi:hypothetical protein